MKYHLFVKEPETVFLECQLCKFLTEIESSIVYQKITAKNTYGGEVVITTDETPELVSCEQCTAVLWPKEYAPKPPKIFNEKPKKPRKKRLTKKQKHYYNTYSRSKSFIRAARKTEGIIKNIIVYSESKMISIAFLEKL